MIARMRLFQFLDSVWSAASREAELVAVVLFILGLSLLGLSFALGLHTVTFDGHLIGNVEILGPAGTSIVAKQVGYAWAPNWGLTGMFFMPLAVYHILLARGTIEPLIERLVDRRMLVTIDFEPVDATKVKAEWRRDSTRWSAVISVVFILIFLFVLFLDFVPVVARWLLSDSGQVASLVSSGKVDIQHPDFEFDWSISAIFNGSEMGPLVNLFFSFLAYLVIPLFGSSFLFAIFIWFFSVCSFFSVSGLRRRNILLVPDLGSPDDRLGFENFERLFDHLVSAAIFTGAIAISMHLQNVYLRAPSQTDIISMVFGSALDDAWLAVREGDLGELLGILVSTREVLETETLSLQTYASAIILFILSAIVFFSVWAWLRTTAKEGATALPLHRDLSPEDQERIMNIKIWPVGWISVNLLIATFVVVGLSMWYVNFISLLIVFFALRMLVLLLNHVKGPVLALYARLVR